MSKAKHLSLLEKAIDASIAAIEVYNKPDFHYREEAFSILMLNAWELLLKARILKEKNNDSRSIEVWETRTKSDGTKTLRKYAKRNRSGNVMVIGMDKAIACVNGYPSHRIDADCSANLDLLKEIRDAAVHLRNFDPALSRRVQEVGSAALRNFLHASQEWFGVDLSRYNFYLMPISFFSSSEIVKSVKANRSAAARNLFNTIGEMAEKQSGSDYFVTMAVELKFVRSRTSDSIDVKLSKSPGALEVVLSEEQVATMWPWDFANLVQQLRNRYSDFLQNSVFHEIKARLEKEDRLCRIRYLDPVRKTISKKYYSQSILLEFDKHYRKR